MGFFLPPSSPHLGMAQVATPSTQKISNVTTADAAAGAGYDCVVDPFPFG